MTKAATNLGNLNERKYAHHWEDEGSTQGHSASLLLKGFVTGELVAKVDSVDLPERD